MVLDRRKISSVPITDTASFPSAALEQCTSLDRAQVEVLKSALTQKIAVIQGPPGTGSTGILKYTSTGSMEFFVAEVTGSRKTLTFRSVL